MSGSILIADDDEGVLSALRLLLKSEGTTSHTASTPSQVLSVLQRQDPDLLLMDLNYSLDTTSGDEGLQLITAVREIDEFIPIIVMSGWGTIELAVSTMKHGANDFIQKPWENDRLLAIIKTQIQLAELRKQSSKLSRRNELLLEESNPAHDLVSESEAMRHTIETITQVAKSDVSVLFTGENGTGKSMFARILHDLSERKNGPLIPVNMGAVTDSLFESEMFGHVKGAFTDAKSHRIGRFELADEGTLFLDEIANTPYSQQSKLLRVLEDRQFERVGSTKTQTVDFRLVTATNSNLDEAVEDNKFRKDLLYRINTVEIEIPPLRQRVEDIVPLATGFLIDAAKKNAQPPLTIDSAAAIALMAYPWPGNVRELKHVMERAQILCENSFIQVHDLGLRFDVAMLDEAADSALDNADSLKTLSEAEAEIINSRLEYFDGDAVKAADSLGMSRSTFYRRLGKAKS